jgi:adenylate kinase
MILILLGAPGAGKGTQSVGLAEALGSVHVSTGDLFRAHLQAGTALGREAEGFMTRGELVPDAVVIGMVQERLAEPDAAAGAVLDGFPRTVPQAEALDAMLAETGAEPAEALLIDVPREALMRRLTGRRVCRACGQVYHVDFKPPPEGGACGVCGGELYQRDDDTPETVANRLAVYDQETAPVIAHYEALGRLRSVDGDGTPDAVGARLRALLGEAPAG